VLATAVNAEGYLVALMRTIYSPYWIQLIWDENVLLGGGLTTMAVNEFMGCVIGSNAPLEVAENTLQWMKRNEIPIGTRLWSIE